ncbi:hypothetical protein KM043_003737 [Ampulex compressa]|nr:hypothetical protein KM043_003737 [Ampulex compressa]
MMLEIEDETRDFVTIYGKDFLPRKAEKADRYTSPPNYPPPLNILNGPYKRYLNTTEENSRLPPNEQSEDPQDHLNRIRERYPRLKRILPTLPPDENLIQREENKNVKSVYQLYHSSEYSPLWTKRFAGRKSPVTLPEDWVISETIQRQTYRNPWKIATENLLRAKRYGTPPNNLDPNLREREILRVRTGDSEYNAAIGATRRKGFDRSTKGAKGRI